MPAFDKSPPELVARFDELAALVPDATRRPMFGYPSCTLNGNMFMSLFGDRLVLRLDEDARRELTETHQATRFEPMPGRPMTGYVAIAPALTSTKAIEPWIERAHAHAAALPPKLKKPRPTR